MHSLDNISARRMQPPRISVTVNGRPIHLKGRAAAVYDRLKSAGRHGITNLDFPGVRVANHILTLRKVGIDIVTDFEQHNGAFAGTHARYRLRSPVLEATA